MQIVINFHHQGTMIAQIAGSRDTKMRSKQGKFLSGTNEFSGRRQQSSHVVSTSVASVLLHKIRAGSQSSSELKLHIATTMYNSAPGYVVPEFTLNRVLQPNM